MPSYQSRYQPRRHTTLTGRIKNAERYDRFYDLAFDALRRGRFPHITLTAGRLLVRVMKGPYDSRAVPPGSSMNTGNRFSGPRLDGRPGQGALYVGTIAGVLREHAHYSLLQKSSSLQDAVSPLWKPGAPDRTAAFMRTQRAGALPPDPESRFYLLRVERPLRFADLRVTSLAPLMTELRSSPGSASQYGIERWSPIDFQISAVNMSDDYSASRGISDAIFDQRGLTCDVGVCAFSSRADTDSGIVEISDDDPTGGLVFAIFGSDLMVVSALTLLPSGPVHAGFDTYSNLRAAVR